MNLIYKVILIFLLITTTSYAEDKGYCVVVDKSTKRVVSKSYGINSTGYSGGLDYQIVCNQSSEIWQKADVEDYSYNTISGTFVKDSTNVIDNRKVEERKEVLRRQILTLAVLKDKADELGYTAESARLQADITSLVAELQSL